VPVPKTLPDGIASGNYSRRRRENNLLLKYEQLCNQDNQKNNKSKQSKKLCRSDASKVWKSYFCHYTMETQHLEQYMSLSVGVLAGCPGAIYIPVIAFSN